MAIRQIRTIGDEILTKECKPVKEMNERTLELIEDMFETMYESNGVGLAAPQVGVLKQIVVMDVDGVLAPYEFSELSHSMTDDEWDRLVASGENPYKDVRPIKLMQEFIQKKGVDKVYTCSKSPLSEIPGKKAFIKDNYNLPDDNIYFTLEKTEKLTVLQTLQQKLGLKPSQIAIVEDTVKTLDYIRAHSDFVTVHVSSFME